MSQQGGFAVLSFRQGAHGEGPDGERWSIPDSVSIVRIAEEGKAMDLATSRSENNWRSAVVPWGDDLVESLPLHRSGESLDDRLRSADAVDPTDNCRVRRALGLPVRYFQCDDSGCLWFIVAVNQDHAVELLRRNCDSFGQEGVPFGLAVLTWSELTVEQAAGKRSFRDEAVEPVPLSQCHIGECFSTEW